MWPAFFRTIKSKGIFAILLSAFLLIHLRPVAQEMFMSADEFSLLSGRLESVCCDSLLWTNTTINGFESMYLWQREHFLKLNVDMYGKCAELPGKSVETEVLGYMASYFHSDKLDYFRVLHPTGGSCITLTTDKHTSASTFDSLLTISGILSFSVSQSSWPDFIPPEFRVSGTILQMQTNASDIDGFCTELHLTMLNDSVAHQSLNQLSRKFENKDDFLQSSKTLLLVKGMTISRFLGQSPDGHTFGLVYYSILNSTNPVTIEKQK